MRTILCYGDSNTWGCVPGTLERHAGDIRWTGVMAAQLGVGYQVVEDGISGRRTVWDDPCADNRNGLLGLGYALYREKPLDLVILMLGTNDLHHGDAAGSCEGMEVLAHRILNANVMYPGTSPVFPAGPRLLLVSPVLTCPEPDACPQIPRAAEFLRESSRFAALTRALAQRIGADWLDAAAYARASNLDGCHLDGENHRLLGTAMACKVKKLFESY